MQTKQKPFLSSTTSGRKHRRVPSCNPFDFNLKHCCGPFYPVFISKVWVFKSWKLQKRSNCNCYVFKVFFVFLDWKWLIFPALSGAFIYTIQIVLTFDVKCEMKQSHPDSKIVPDTFYNVKSFPHTARTHHLGPPPICQNRATRIEMNGGWVFGQFWFNRFALGWDTTTPWPAWGSDMKNRSRPPKGHHSTWYVGRMNVSSVLLSGHSPICI